jgi:bacterioferritin (cytochrome b1)
MPCYLVIAHQTATSPELIQAVTNITVEQGDAEFVLLVPETPVEDLLDWQEGDSQTIARRTGEAARAKLAEMGVKVVHTATGDPSPLSAIANELADGGRKFDGIIIATLPLQRSRWLTLDQPTRVERRFGIPVTHVVAHSITMTRERLISGLNDDLNLELETVVRGVIHAAVGRGMAGHELRELLKKEIPGELDHAMFLADKIVALGGEPRVKVVVSDKVDNASKLLPENIAAEKRAIANYNRRIDEAIQRKAKR